MASATECSCFSQPAGRPKTSSEPARRGRGIVFRISRISLSAGRRACEPAAKPAIPGFVWPERTRGARWTLDPPTPTFASAIQCHQKSTSNSAGSSVGSLAPPRATPRLGGVYVSCQCQYLVLPLLLCTRPARARPSIGGQRQAPLPLRASSRGVPPGPGALEYGNRRLSTSWHFEAHRNNALCRRAQSR
jgi:hypothetical protein